jgi:hypothetical protein
VYPVLKERNSIVRDLDDVEDGMLGVLSAPDLSFTLSNGRFPFFRSSCKYKLLFVLQLKTVTMDALQ